MFAFGWVQKVRKHFLRKVFRVCGHLVCLTCPELFLEGTSAGCFEPSQIETTTTTPPNDEFLSNTTKQT